jgi:hypothetical protein
MDWKAVTPCSCGLPWDCQCPHLIRTGEFAGCCGLTSGR